MAADLNRSSLETEFEYDDGNIDPYPISHVGEKTYLSILFVTSLLSNTGLIAHQILKIRRQRNEASTVSKSMPFLLINVAAGNIFTSFFSVLFITVHIGTYGWTAGRFMCKLMLFLSSFEHFLTPYSVLALLMGYIAERATKRDAKTIALFFIVPVWFFSAAFSLPRFIMFDTYEYPVYGSSESTVPTPMLSHCHPTRETHWLLIIHMCSIPAFGLVLPAIVAMVLSCCYCRVGRRGQGEKNKTDEEAVIPYDTSSEECSYSNGVTAGSKATTVTQDTAMMAYIQPSYIPLTISIITYLIISVASVMFIVGFYHLFSILLFLSSKPVAPLVVLMSVVLPKICKRTPHAFQQFS